MYSYQNHQVLIFYRICSFCPSLPASSSNSLWASFPDNKENHLLDAAGKCIPLASEKIAGYAVGQMLGCFALLCWWLVKSQSSRTLESQDEEGPEKASTPKLCSPTHPPCMPYTYFMPLDAIYYFFQGWWVNSKWCETCKWSLVESWPSSWVLSKLSISCFHLSKSRLSVGSLIWGAH